MIMGMGTAFQCSVSLIAPLLRKDLARTLLGHVCNAEFQVPCLKLGFGKLGTVPGIEPRIVECQFCHSTTQPHPPT